MVLFRVLLSVYLVVSCATIIPAQNGKVGINTTTPTTTLDVAGKIRIDNDTTAAQAGMIRWNADKEDFEGYNGTDWLSLTKSSSTWGTIAWKEAVEDFKTTGTTLEQFSHYGQSVAIDGDYAIVGAPGDKVGNNTGQGSAFIYHRDGDAWVQVQQLTASNGGAGHWFGYSVDLSGNYAIVSAPYYGGSAGTAYIFYLSGGTWTQQAQITGTDIIANDLFGYSVSISGDYALVGSVFDDVGPFEAGAAFVFFRTGTTWSQQSKLSALDCSNGDEFGLTVSISGDKAIVGAPYDDTDFNNQGSVYFYLRSGTSWFQYAKKIALEPAANDLFGSSVFIQGDNAIAGSPNDDFTFTNQGSAYYYKYVAGAWDSGIKLSAKSPAANAFFGSSVALDGSLAIVGAEEDGDYRHGTVLLFTQEDQGWRQVIRLSPSDGYNVDYFGTSVRSNGAFIIVGSPDDNIGTLQDQGSVYFFENKN